MLQSVLYLNLSNSTNKIESTEMESDISRTKRKKLKIDQSTVYRLVGQYCFQQKMIFGFLFLFKVNLAIGFFGEMPSLVGKDKFNRLWSDR